jgi:alpha-D-ribose 1-methylphosphonate 5-phosphate C-P lyase
MFSRRKFLGFLASGMVATAAVTKLGCTSLKLVDDGPEPLPVIYGGGMYRVTAVVVSEHDSEMIIARGWNDENVYGVKDYVPSTKEVAWTAHKSMLKVGDLINIGG